MAICYVTLIPITFYFQNIFLHMVVHLSEVKEVSLGGHMALFYCCIIYKCTLPLMVFFKSLPWGIICGLVMFTNFQEGLNPSTYPVECVVAKLLLE